MRRKSRTSIRTAVDIQYSPRFACIPTLSNGGGRLLHQSVGDQSGFSLGGEISSTVSSPPFRDAFLLEREDYFMTNNLPLLESAFSILICCCAESMVPVEYFSLEPN